MKSLLRSLLCLSLSFCPIAWAGLNHEPLSGEAYTLTNQAYQALGRQDDATAETLVRQARALSPASYQLAMLLLDIQMRRGEWQQASQLSAELLRELPDDSLLLANSGFIAMQQSHNEQARSYFEAALRNPGLTAQQEKNVRDALATLPEKQSAPISVPVAVSASAAEPPLYAAYRFLNQHDEVNALAKFEEGFAQQPGTANQYADAAYTAKHLYRNDEAIALLQKALDANAALPAEQKAFTPQQAFTYRREIQQMNRSWGLVSSLSYQYNALTSTSKVNTLQGGMEAYWQPNDFAGNRDGHLFQLFVGGNETLYDAQGGNIGKKTAQGTVGVRYKPFSSLGMVAVAQKILPLGNAIPSDTLLQLAYSDAVGSEVNVVDKGWRTWQYFADAAYFVNARRSYNTFEGSYGQVYRFSENTNGLLWTPHLVLAAEYDSAALQPSAVGVGPGLKMRYWLREDRYNAPPSWFELNVQYRFELTHANRSKGLLMRAIYWY